MAVWPLKSKRRQPQQGQVMEERIDKTSTSVVVPRSHANSSATLLRSVRWSLCSTAWPRGGGLTACSLRARAIFRLRALRACCRARWAPIVRHRLHALTTSRSRRLSGAFQRRAGGQMTCGGQHTAARCAPRTCTRRRPTLQTQGSAGVDAAVRTCSGATAPLDGRVRRPQQSVCAQRDTTAPVEAPLRALAPPHFSLTVRRAPL